MSTPMTTHEPQTSFAIRLMEDMVVPTFVLNPQGEVIIWNRACERLTGILSKQVVGTHLHWQAFYSAARPCLADLLLQNDWQAIDKLYSTYEHPNTPVYGVHAENWCSMPGRGGQRLYLTVNAGPVFDASGQLTAVVETIQDITEKKLAELHIQEQAEQLKAHYEENQREAEMAQRIVEHQIRTDLLEQSGVQYVVSPASRFSGDMILAARSPSGKLYALLVDATGHGLAAAVSVLPVVHEFYRLVEQEQPLIQIVESLNFVLVNALPSGRFVAAGFVCLDEPAKTGEIWNGGIPDALLIDAGSGALQQRFASTHLPLGISRAPEILGKTESFAWQGQSQLLLMSDGVLESTAPDGAMFGDQRLLQTLAQPGKRLDNIQQQLDQHRQGQPAHDDVSLLIIPCN